MGQHRQRLVWAWVACAAVVVQGSPKALCQACDRPCCAGLAGGCGPKTAEAAVESTGGCPLCCAAKADPRHADTPDQPCHCQLKARQDEPLSSSRSSLPAFAGGTPAIGAVVLPPVAPQVLGVSREYRAAALAIPIRPPRILFGIWRN